MDMEQLRHTGARCKMATEQLRHTGVRCKIATEHSRRIINIDLYSPWNRFHVLDTDVEIPRSRLEYVTRVQQQVPIV